MEPIQLVTIDVDGTLIQDNSWYALNTALGITPEEDAAMYTAYMAGDLTYADWIQQLVHLYKERGQATEKSIAKILNEQVVLTKGADDLVHYLKRNGYELVVLSGSFDMLAERVARVLGIGTWHGNARFVFDAAGTLVTLDYDGEERYAKAARVRALANERGISVEACACIGDGGNDSETFALTKHGITFTSARSEIKQVAWKVVDSLPDVKDVL